MKSVLSAKNILKQLYIFLECEHVRYFYDSFIMQVRIE